MISKRKFRRTVITIEVLTEDETEYDPDSLAVVAHDIYEGDASGRWEITTSEIVDGPRMAQLLMEQSSDPGFFRLTEDGEDEDECEDEDEDEN